MPPVVQFGARLVRFLFFLAADWASAGFDIWCRRGAQGRAAASSLEYRRRNLLLAFPGSDPKACCAMPGGTMLELPLVAAQDEAVEGTHWEVMGHEHLSAPDTLAARFSAQISNQEVRPRATFHEGS